MCGCVCGGGARAREFGEGAENCLAFSRFFFLSAGSMSSSAASAKEEELKEEVGKLQALQREISTHTKNREQYETQLHENQLVKKELELLEEGDDVFKLVGPVLIKQDLEEAKGNVNKRIEYISAEIERQEKQIKDVEDKQEKIKEHCIKLQKALQAEQQKQQKTTQ
eukprot:m.129867 g.129867  ORF g.129867 m.129867 type:complete len:167 (+) comp19959_c0_seq4:843-1343(+)